MIEIIIKIILISLYFSLVVFIILAVILAISFIIKCVNDRIEYHRICNYIDNNKNEILEFCSIYENKNTKKIKDNDTNEILNNALENNNIRRL